MRKRRFDSDGEDTENSVGNGNSFNKIAFASAGGYDTVIFILFCLAFERSHNSGTSQKKYRVVLLR